MKAIRFWRGRHLYQIAPAHEGVGYIGLCGDQVVATAPDAAGVMRALIMAARWRHWRKDEEGLAGRHPQT